MTRRFDKDAKKLEIGVLRTRHGALDAACIQLIAVKPRYVTTATTVPMAHGLVLLAMPEAAVAHQVKHDTSFLNLQRNSMAAHAACEPASALRRSSAFTQDRSRWTS